MIVESDSGITGVGEACTDIGFFGEPLEEVQSAIDLYLGPKLLGKDPFDREQLLYEIDFPGNSCAKSGIDLALHDLLGKALDLPVCNLIGGSQRRQVLAVMEVAGGAPDGMARQCVEWVEQGVRGFKAKVGGIPEEDAERLEAIRSAVGPEIMLRADANQGYTPKEAIRLCRLCERRGVGLELLEQPVPKWDLAGMAQVRAAVDALIEADEAAYTPHDVVQIIRAQAADVINIKIAKAGGLYQSKKIAAVAEAAGLECVIGTAWGLGRQGCRQTVPGSRHALSARRRRIHRADAARPAARRPAGGRPGAPLERRLPQRPARPRSRRHRRRAKAARQRTPQAPLTTRLGNRPPSNCSRATLQKIRAGACTPLRRPQLVQNSDPCQSWVRNVRWWSSLMPSSVVRSWRSSDTTMRRAVSG